MTHNKPQIAQDFLLIFFGSLIQAVGYSIFIAPFNIVPGGVYGISIIINHLSKGVFETFPNGLPIGTVALFFNIPLFLLATKRLGKLSGGKTVVTFILVAFFTDLITSLTGGRPLVEGDAILSSFYGGAILGLSVFMIFKANSTCAGTDVLSRVLARDTNIKISNLIIMIDSTVVLLGLIAFGDWKVPLYSWLVIFIFGKVVEFLQPENPNKAVFIVSEMPQAIRDVIINDLGLRGTYLHGKGLYAGKEKDIIFLITERKHLLELKKAVLATDPQAFITTTNAASDAIKPSI
ncbi:YitT family protein [Porphyromonas pogonae]|uniref:YitT family protein n=1 Tax=Porphyromonas pogonae TaxID=867595 RepID=UPI002E78B21C|nr:YitT family protein [Porphyromonas pogonae]